MVSRCELKFWHLIEEKQMAINAVKRLIEEIKERDPEFIGAAMTSGTSGVSGSSGTSGSRGATGSSGTSGTGVTSGTSGVSGTSGTSGT
jgi:hypothetical protein